MPGTDQGTVSINGKVYRLAPQGPQDPPSLQWSTYEREALRIPRSDVVPGKLPNEYWWIGWPGTAGFNGIYYKQPRTVVIDASGGVTSVDVHDGVIALGPKDFDADTAAGGTPRAQAGGAG